MDFSLPKFYIDLCTRDGVFHKNEGKCMDVDIQSTRLQCYGPCMLFPLLDSIGPASVLVYWHKNHIKWTNITVVMLFWSYVDGLIHVMIEIFPGIFFSYAVLKYCSTAQKGSNAFFTKN